MRMLFFGTPQFSADILRFLVQDPTINLVGLICQPDEPIGRKKILTAPPTKLFAQTLGVPIFQPTKLKEESFLADIDRLQVDVAVIIAYGRILPKILLDRIPFGFINVHPSLLPKYRGPSPMQATIVNGDPSSGVTIMKIDEGMDTGPILAQTSFPLDAQETIPSLTKKVVEISGPLLLETLKKYSSGSLIPIPQTGESSLCKLLSRDDGKIDWHHSASTIERQIRGLNPWPGTWTTWNLKNKELTVKILSASLMSAPDIFNPQIPIGAPYIHHDRLIINAGNNTALHLLTLQPAGSKPMTGADFARGYCA